MDRKEFCELLVNSREQSGKSASDVSFEMKMLLHSLRRVEKGENNFKIDKIFKYVDIIGCKFIVNTKEKSVYCDSYKSLINFLINKRKEGFSQKKLGKVADVHYSTILNVENFKVIMSIDTLLKILEVLNCTITIEPK